MALARNHIYYHDYTDERGNEYRLEMIPAECDAVGEPVMLPTTPTRTPFPDNIFLPSLTIRNEYADQKVLPIGLPQKNELVLKLKLPRTGYDDWYNLIALPVLYSNYKESPVFGVMPTRIFTRNTVFATLPKSYTEAGTGTVVTATYSIRSTSPDVALVVTEETTSGVTNFVFKVATGSPDAAFVIDSVTTFTYTNGTTLTWNNTGGYVIGAPAGYEYLTVPRTYRYGNVWRVWERTGSTVGTLRMEAMQRRVPPVKNVIATDGYTFDITAIDTVRCAMESTTVDECRAELPAAGKCQELISISSAATVVRYKLRDGERFNMYSVAQFYEASGKAIAKKLKGIRRSTQTVNLYGPRHIAFYDFAAGTPSVPSAPGGGYIFEDCSFVAGIGSAGVWRGGVLSPSSSNASESWSSQYGNAFDLFTDLASATASKYQIQYGIGGVAAGINIYRRAPFNDGSFPPTDDEIPLTAWIGEPSTEYGAAAIRGVTAQVSQPDGDDQKEYKHYSDYSERDDELSPKVLLHNIPTYNAELVTNTLFAPTGGATGEMVAPYPLSDNCRIDLGDGIVIGPAPWGADWIGGAFNRDLTIGYFQAKLNYATELCRALNECFSTNALLTFKGTLRTSESMNSTHVGSAYMVEVPGSRSVRMILVSCEEDCVSGECEIEFIGIDKQA